MRWLSNLTCTFVLKATILFWYRQCECHKLFLTYQSMAKLSLALRTIEKKFHLILKVSGLIAPGHKNCVNMYI